MSVIIALAALALLMLAAYRGYSVILFAPIAALGAVLLTDPSAVAPAFTGVFMEKMVGFIKLYFPVFLLGAVFGKLIELSGFSRSIVAAAIRLLGTRQAMLVIVLVCALLTYGGVSLFVVVFAVYPFAAEMFRQSNIPKRLIPATIALGAFSFTMDALPGTPQIQNIIPSTFFNTTAWAAPWLGLIGAIFVVCAGMLFLQRQRNKAQRAGEGYGTDLRNEPETAADIKLPNPWIAAVAAAGRRHHEPAVYPVDSAVVRQDPQPRAAGHGRAGDHRNRQAHGDLGGSGRLAGRHHHGVGVRLPGDSRQVGRRQ